MEYTHNRCWSPERTKQRKFKRTYQIIVFYSVNPHKYYVSIKKYKLTVQEPKDTCSGAVLKYFPLWRKYCETYATIWWHFSEILERTHIVTMDKKKQPKTNPQQFDNSRAPLCSLKHTPTVNRVALSGSHCGLAACRVENTAQTIEAGSERRRGRP